MTVAQFEMNMAKTQMNKAVSFMTMAPFMTLPKKIRGAVVHFCGNLITLFAYIIFDLYTLTFLYLYVSQKL
jgi:hypothetical protein